MKRNVLANWIGQFVVLICGLILPRYANDHIGQTQLGIWDFGWSMVAYLSMLNIGVGSSINRYVARFRATSNWSDLNRIVSSCACVFLSAAGIGILITIALVPTLSAQTFGDHLGDARWMMLMLGLACATDSCFTVYNGVITGYERYDLCVKIEIFTNLVRLGAIVGLLTAGHGLPAMATAVFLIALLEGSLKFLVAHRVCPSLHLSITSVTRRSLTDVVIFGLKSFMGNIARITLYQGNSLLIFAFLGPLDLAVFARALALVGRADQVVFQFARVLSPAASGAEAREDSKSLTEVVLVGSRYSVLIALPMVLVLTILDRALMRVWMGPEFALLPILPILAVGHLAALSQWGPLSILVGMNRHGAPALATLVAGVLSIALSAVLLSVFHAGLTGVALSIGISLTLATLLVTPVLLSRAIGLPVLTYAGQVLSSVRLVIPFGLWLVLARILLNDNSLLQLIVGLGGGAVVLLLSYWKLLMPQSIKTKLLAVACLGKRA